MNKRKLLSKALVVTSVFVASTMMASAAEMVGAGSSFFFPMVSKWAESYKAKTGNNLNYQSIGSGAGIKQINAKTVDFGASDDPVKAEDLEKLGQVQFPAIIGGVVPVVNIEGVKPGELKLTGELLGKIFAGHILSWDDKRIVALNPKVKIPHTVITIVTRSDGSGTTAVFTNYLSKVSEGFRDEVGAGKTVNWTASSNIGGKGNEGVAANVQRVANSIGYVEWAYAKKNNLSHVLVQNASGSFPLPGDEAFAAAAASTDWSKFPGMGTFITNASGKDAWPIAGAVFVVIYKNPSDKAKAGEVIKFFDWAFQDGKTMAKDLDYAPMPDATTSYIKSNVWSQVNVK